MTTSSLNRTCTNHKLSWKHLLILNIFDGNHFNLRQLFDKLCGRAHKGITNTSFMKLVLTLYPVIGWYQLVYKNLLAFGTGWNIIFLKESIEFEKIIWHILSWGTAYKCLLYKTSNRSFSRSQLFIFCCQLMIDKLHRPFFFQTSQLLHWIEIHFTCNWSDIDNKSDYLTSFFRNSISYVITSMPCCWWMQVIGQ